MIGKPLGAGHGLLQPDGEGGVQFGQFAMGTIITHRVFGGRATSAVRRAAAEVERLEGLLSRFRQSSEVAAVNRRAGAGGVRVSADTYDLLALALECCEACDGLFDVTIGPLVSVWQMCAGEARVPARNEIESALALVGYSDLILDPAASRAALRLSGQTIDVGGIGKGFAGDRLLEQYREHGVSSAFVNLGGNVATLGCRPDGLPWRG